MVSTGRQSQQQLHRHHNRRHASGSGGHRHHHDHYRSRQYRLHGASSEISCCVKYTVFGFNVLFWIIGFLFLGIGTWAQIEKTNPYYHVNQLSKFYLDPSWLLIIVGTVTFIIGFSGCVGALRENTCFLAIYSSLLGLLLLAEAGVVLVVMMSKDWLETEMITKFDDMVVLYRDDPDLQSFIDWMQSDWKCCGINKPDDWDMNIYFNSSAKHLKSVEAGGVPFSCCIDSGQFTNYECGYRARSDLRAKMGNLIYTEGCLPKLMQWLNSNFLYVGAAMFLIAIVQLDKRFRRRHKSSKIKASSMLNDNHGCESVHCSRGQFLGLCFAQDLRSDIFAQRAKWSRTH